MIKNKSLIVKLLYLSITMSFSSACNNPDGDINSPKEKDEKTQYVAVTKIEITTSTDRIAIGDTIHISCIITPDNATNQNVKWSSSDPSIAIVSDEGIVTAISEGNCEVYASVAGYLGKGKCMLYVIDPDIYKAVDLGLPSGTKWGSEDASYRKAWADTDNKYHFDWSSYKWKMKKDGNYILTKYCKEDGLKELKNEDDVAYVYGARKWRTPTRKEFQELINECTWKFEDLTKRNQYTGKIEENGRYKVTGPNGNYIFFNFNGEGYIEHTIRYGEIGVYWTREIADEDLVNIGTPGDDPYNHACVLAVAKGSYDIEALARCWGIPTRPVRIE